MSRKSKAKKIVPDHREPNGRPQRPTKQQLAAIEREQRMREIAPVCRQPHRRWHVVPNDPRLESPFGRFCVGCSIPTEHQRAGERYRDLIRSWRLANGLTCPFGYSSEGMPTIDGLADPHTLEVRIDQMYAVMKAKTKAGALAVYAMCSRNEDIPSAMHPHAAAALAALSDWLDGTNRAAGRKHGAGVLAWRGADNVFVVEDRDEAC